MFTAKMTIVGREWVRDVLYSMLGHIWQLCNNKLEPDNNPPVEIYGRENIDQNIILFFKMLGYKVVTEKKSDPSWMSDLPDAFVTTITADVLTKPYEFYPDEERMRERFPIIFECLPTATDIRENTQEIVDKFIKPLDDIAYNIHYSLTNGNNSVLYDANKVEKYIKHLIVFGYKISKDSFFGDNYKITL